MKKSSCAAGASEFRPGMRFLASFIAGMLILTFSARTALTQGADIDPEAISALQAMSNYLGSRSEYSFKADIMYDDVLKERQKIQFNAELTAYLTKPSKFAVSYVSDMGGYKLWYDAGQATILQVPTNDVATTLLPATVEQALNKLMEEDKFAPALSEFLFINTYKVLTRNVITGASFGTSRVSGTICRHLVFVEKDIDWQIWIEDGKRPVPRKLVITYKNLPESPQFIALIKDWVSDKPITSAAYKPDIPKINNRVDFSDITGNPKFQIGSIRQFQQAVSY